MPECRPVRPWWLLNTFGCGPGAPQHCWGRPSIATSVQCHGLTFWLSQKHLGGYWALLKTTWESPTKLEILTQVLFEKAKETQNWIWVGGVGQCWRTYLAWRKPWVQKLQHHKKTSAHQYTHICKQDTHLKLWHFLSGKVKAIFVGSFL